MIKMRIGVLYNRFIYFPVAARLLTMILSYGIAYSSNAQTTLILPSKFQCYPGENEKIRFHITENNKEDDLGINQNNVQQLLHHTPDGRVSDLAPALSVSSVSSINLASLDEGTHVLIFHSKNAFKEIAAPVFKLSASV